MYGPVMCVRTLIIGFIITTAVCDTIPGGVSSSAVRVTLPKGEVEGKIKKTWYSLAFHDEPIQFFSFEGIPYAAPPVGDLRFRPPAQRLVRGVLDFENENGVEIFKFGPVLEKTFGRNTAILPRTPYAAYQSGEFSDVPTMISYTTSEFAHYLYTDQILEKFMSRSDSMIPRNWKLRVGSKLFNETISRIKNFYFDSKEINLSKHDDVVKCIQLVSDYKFVTTINEVARVHSNYAKSPLYLYRFAYRGGLNNPNMERLGIQGACHGDDKAYILPKLNKTIPMWSSDNFVRRRHLTIYKNFMENNDPTFGPYTILLPVKWPPFTNDKKKFLHINGDIVVSQDPDERKVKFWEDLEEYIMKEDNVNKDWKLQTCLTK